MGVVEQGTLVALGLFVLGVVFNAGRVSARLDALERWRAEVLGELHEIRSGVARVEQLVRHGE